MEKKCARERSYAHSREEKETYFCFFRGKKKHFCGNRMTNRHMGPW